MIIKKVSSEDAGTYTCIAKNRAGENQFQVNLSVIEKERVSPPRFLEKPQSLEVKEGDAAKFECKAKGTPTPMISWLTDGKVVEQRSPLVSASAMSEVSVQEGLHMRVETDSKEGRSALFIDRARPVDSTWYQCTVANIAGSISARARLVVIGMRCPS